MAATITGRISNRQSRPDPHAPVRELLRLGRPDEAIVKLCAMRVTAPEDLAVKQLLFDAFSQKRDWDTALALAQELVRCKPDDRRLRRSLILTLCNMQRHADAVPQAEQYVAQHGEDAVMLNVLKVASFYSGRADEALRYGQRALELRDAQACASPPAMTVTEPTGRQGRQVISFSLWGSAPVYCAGAMINLVLARTVYPGWTCRFYVDASVPRACVEFLRGNGAELRPIEQEYPATGQLQRFLVMNDPSVERFLVRDCDARLSAAEAELVAEWTASGRPFHVVRDHVLHNEPIMAGLWGGRTDCGIDMVALIKRCFVHGPTAKYGDDQHLLGRMLWPLIRGRCLVHDKHYRLAGVHTVPLRDPNSRFGAGHQDTAAVLAEAERLGIPRLP
jgi:hypothetical protein